MKKFIISKNQIRIRVNLNIYSLEAVYGAAYSFLDKCYLYLDAGLKKEIIVQIKSKKNLNKKKLEELGEDFLNKLLNYSLRYQISKSNRKIREYIVGTALLSTLGEGNEEKGWKEDPLEIATPWEDKYGKK